MPALRHFFHPQTRYVVLTAASGSFWVFVSKQHPLLAAVAGTLCQGYIQALYQCWMETWGDPGAHDAPRLLEQLRRLEGGV